MASIDRMYPKNRNRLLFYVFLLIFPVALCSQQLSDRTGFYSPEEQLKQFELAEGFAIELVASEEEGIINPVDLTFDDAGRLWTQTAKMYPLDPVSGIKWQELLALMDDERKYGCSVTWKDPVYDLFTLSS